MRNPSERYHNRVARQYDAIYDDPYWALHDELTWRLVKPHLPTTAGAACADLGCGTGKWGWKLLKSGFTTTFLDHSAAMVEQVRDKLASAGPRAKRATLVVGDIVAMPELPSDTFALTLAMGDPVSICSDPSAATREMFRTTAPGGIVIATGDNKLAALDHYMERGLEALEVFVRTGKTQWITGDKREQFDLTTFTPTQFRKLFESAGFDVVSLTGKTILPIRENRQMLEKPDAIERLLKLEAMLSKDESAVSRAGHLQIVARKPAAC